MVPRPPVAAPRLRHRSTETVKHQMDHLFVSQSLARHLRACDVGSHDQVFGRNLSDHLPIIADFDTSGAPDA
jgi:endonuclease/exonuclease/phosphatase family metal-dependent hydrolase